MPSCLVLGMTPSASAAAVHLKLSSTTQSVQPSPENTQGHRSLRRTTRRRCLSPLHRLYIVKPRRTEGHAVKVQGLEPHSFTWACGDNHWVAQMIVSPLTFDQQLPQAALEGRFHGHFPCQIPRVSARVGTVSVVPPTNLSWPGSLRSCPPCSVFPNPNAFLKCRL